MHYTKYVVPLYCQAKPVLQQGEMEGLVDPNMNYTNKNLKQIHRMIEAAGACIESDESRRPNMKEIISILTQVEPSFRHKKKSSLCGKGYVHDHYSQLKRTKSEVKNHFALAMLGVTGYEDDDHLTPL